MSLSQKTLQIDTILVESLYTREIPLSTSQVYMATVSPVGPFISSVARTNTQTNTELVLTTVSSLTVTYTTSVFAGSDSRGDFDAFGTGALFSNPKAVAMGPTGTLYVFDTSNRKIRTIDTYGNVTTLLQDTNSSVSRGIAVNSAGIVYYPKVDSIIRVDQTGTVSVFASGFTSIQGITVDSNGILYVFDSFQIKKIDTNGNTTTLATISAVIESITVNSQGVVYVAVLLASNPAIYSITPNGTVTPITTPSFATSINGITVNSAGIVYFTTTSNSVWMLDLNNNSTRVYIYPSQTQYLNGITVDSRGILYISTGNSIQRLVPPNVLYYFYSYVLSTRVEPGPQPVCGCTPVTKPEMGQFLEWTCQPISTLYYPFFHGSNPKDIIDKLSRFSTTISNAATDIPPLLDQINTLSTTTNKTYSTLTAMNSSTITSYSSYILYNSTFAASSFNILNSALSTLSTNTIQVSTNLYAIFSTYSTNIVQQAGYYYKLRPIPLASPVPTYWSGYPPRYIGPTLSSMYLSTVANQGLMNSYVNLLSTTSTLWGRSNSTIQHSTLEYIAYTETAPNYIDSGSTISTAFSHYYSTFAYNISTGFYGNDVSTISTHLTTYANAYYTTVPTNGPYISTAASSIITTNSSFNANQLTYIDNRTLIFPTNTFADTEAIEVASAMTAINSSQNYQTLSTLNSSFLSVIVPAINVLTISTTVAAYKTISTYGTSIFSTFSTLFPFILGETSLSTSSTFVNTVLSFSTMMNQETSTVYALNQSYIAAPGVSSISSNLSTYTGAAYATYSSQFSTLSTMLQFSTVIYQAALSTMMYNYSTIRLLANYSTPYTTDFASIQASTVYTSSIQGNTLGIQVNPTGLYTVAVKGGINATSVCLPTLDIYATDSTVVTSGLHIIQAQTSNIIFNDAFTITQPSLGYSSLVGINTTTPAYALDVVGDARKLTGTSWRTVSDGRIKHLESDPDYETLLYQVSTLRLVRYEWSEDYRVTHDLPRHDYIGFLSQEVEKVFPDAVTLREEEGFPDFRSLSTDQIMKAKFALTRHLIKRISTLQVRINNLL